MTLHIERDSTCMADDVTAPNAAEVEVVPEADVRALCDALLAAGYVPSVASGSTWSLWAGGQPLAVMHERWEGKMHRLEVLSLANARAETLGGLQMKYHLARSIGAVAREI